MLAYHASGAGPLVWTVRLTASVKLFAKLLAVIFVCLILWVCWVWKRTNDCQQTYLQVQRGDSPARVVELWGQPAHVTMLLQTNLAWEDKRLYFTNGRCIQQFHYYPPFSICGESWVIGFDERSNVVSKFHIISP